MVPLVAKNFESVVEAEKKFVVVPFVAKNLSRVEEAE